MSGVIDNIQVEPCRVYFDNVDIGFTDGDIEITPTEDVVDVTAHQEGTNTIDGIRTGKNIEAISITFKETTVAKMQTLLGYGGGESNTTAQVATLTTVADVADSLHETTFPLVARDGTKYLFQIITSAVTAPVIPGWTVVQVTVATGATANAVADAVAAAIDALAGFAAPNPGANVITITWSTAGAVPSGSDDGNTGFTFLVTVVGASDLVGWGSSKDFTSVRAQSAKLHLHPVVRDDADLTADLAFWVAYPMLESIVQSGENPKSVVASFKILPDMTKPAAIRLFALGDHS